MSKGSSVPPPYGPPPAAPPSYAQAVGGVPPTAPYIPTYHLRKEPEILTTIVPVVGPNPTHMVCPHCGAEIDTSTKSEPSTKAYIASLILCVIGCFWGCCLIPCCMDSCRNVKHKCPNCDSYLGTYKR
ncbi:LITAF domain-containing protein-like [Rhynchophorus ferrugineus]|uniref:LITAF domain-containing protein n=1 Tax=Rhynchophorus ferrugineus TaxID=354439 RepID=A0A834I4A1_RHYFE|nr:hypothetical protein GWI33_015568 [Rhynchophorus ferrugineus]